MSFKNNDRLLINTWSDKAYWTYKTSRTSFNVNQINQMIKILIDSTYFTFGNQIYKQTIGIPMGSNASSFLANLFLHHYELEFCKKNMRNNYNLCCKLNNTYRYQDDLTSINCGGIFENHIKDIYPDSLELIRVNSDNRTANVLDINVNINMHKVTTIDVYDKRTSYNFDVTIFPHRLGNVPDNMCANSYRTTTKIFNHICSNNEISKRNVSRLHESIKHHGYTKKSFINA